MSIESPPGDAAPVSKREGVGGQESGEGLGPRCDQKHMLIRHGTLCQQWDSYVVQVVVISIGKHYNIQMTADNFMALTGGLHAPCLFAYS